MTDAQIAAIAGELAIIRRLSAEPYVMAAVSRIEAIIDPELERIDQARRREMVAAMRGAELKGEAA